MVDVDGNIPLYSDLILLLWFKTEAGLSNSQLVLWITPVGNVYRAYQTDILNIPSTTDILQSKVLLTPTRSEIQPNNPNISPCQPYYIILWPTEIITW